MQGAAQNHDPSGVGNLPSTLPLRNQQLAPMDPRSQALTTLVRQEDVEQGEKEFEFLQYWQVIVKHKWTVIAAFTIVVLTGLMVTLLTTPMFRATSTLQIDRQAMRVVNMPGGDSLEAPTDFEFYETQFQLLRSRTLAEKVAASLDPEDPAFAMMSAPSPWQKFQQLIFGVDKKGAQPVSPEDLRGQLVGLVRGGLWVEPIIKSRLVKINFDSPDPALSAKIANAIAEGFIESNMERRIDNSSYAKEFLEDRLEQVKLKLQDSESALANFAQEERIVNIDDRQSLLTNDLASLNAALTEAKQERIDVESRMRQTQGAGIYSHPQMLANPGVQALRSTRGKLEADYQEKLVTFKPNLPLMLQIKSQMEEIDKQLEAEVQLIKASMVATFQSAKDKEGMLQTQVDLLVNDVLALQGRSTSFTVLEREVETNRQLYDALLQRYKAIGITSNVDANNVSVVDSALAPGGPFSPNLFRNLLLAAFAGMALGVFLAFLFEFLDDTLKRPDEIEKHLGIGVLGVIPRLDGVTPQDAALDPRSAFSEAYRSVRTSLQFSTEDGVPRCLLITSPSASEGKSTTAYTLACNFAQLGRRVLLIDADLRNPSLHHLLGGDNSIGLSNYLAGSIKPAAAIRPTRTLRLTFISAGPLPPNPAELLAGPKMMSLLGLAGEKFDQVIIDGPPIMGLADAPILSNIASGTLLVIEAGTSRIATAKAALKRLFSARAHVVGALITKFDARMAGYGYGYGGDYGGYHYYSYGENSNQPRLTKV